MRSNLVVNLLFDPCLNQVPSLAASPAVTLAPMQVPKSRATTTASAGFTAAQACIRRTFWPATCRSPRRCAISPAVSIAEQGKTTPS